MDTSAWLSILLSAIAFLLGALYLYLNVAFSYWKKRNIPYLKPTFPFGNLRDLLMRQKSMGGAYADIYRKMDGMKFGGVFLAHRPVFIIKDPDMIKNCLLKDFDSFHDHGFVFDEKIDPFTGNLFMLNGKKWKNLRSVLSPTFSSGKIKNMFTTLVESAQGLKTFIDEHVQKTDVVEMKDVVARFTTDVIASCAFGIQCNCLKYPDAEFRHWGRRMVEPSFMERIVGILYTLVPSIPIFLKLPLTPKIVSDFFRKVVKETIEFRMENTVKRDDFMQLLIDLKEPNQRHEGMYCHEQFHSPYYSTTNIVHSVWACTQRSYNKLTRHSVSQTIINQLIQSVSQSARHPIIHSSIHSFDYSSIDSVIQ
jgi:cytochrome P450 family 6